jgi:hypothetical protein
MPPGPRKMVLAFVDDHGKIYSNYVPKDSTVNDFDILTILPIFRMRLKINRGSHGDRKTVPVKRRYTPPPLCASGLRSTR